MVTRACGWDRLIGAFVLAGACALACGRPDTGPVPAADHDDARLAGHDFAGADLRGASFRRADLREADLSRADLREADLRGADLRGASLSGARLRGADLRTARLNGVDLSALDLGDVDLRGAQADAHTRWPASLEPAHAGVVLSRPRAEPEPK